MTGDGAAGRECGPSDRVVVAQFGSRESYSVPRMLKRLGCLERLYVDMWVSGRSYLRYIPGLGRRMQGRFATELEGDLVRDRTLRELGARLWRDVPGIHGTQPIGENWVLDGSRFGSWARNDIAASGVLPGGVLSFSFCARELFDWAARAKIGTILNQVDAAAANGRILEEECLKGRSSGGHRIPKSDVWQRLRDEWDLATVVVANSDWSRTQLVEQGLPAEKVEVVPCAIDCSRPTPSMEDRRTIRGKGPLEVLYVGRVNTLKGLWYLFEAMRGVPESEARLTCVGPVEESTLLTCGRGDGARIVGPVSREAVAEYLSHADVLVFPTLSDGFGLVQLEALAAGVPVIATERCGRVVTDGIDGLLVPAQSVEGLRGAIRSLARDRERLVEMSRATAAKLADFSLEAVARRWRMVLGRAKKCKTSADGRGAEASAGGPR